MSSTVVVDELFMDIQSLSELEAVAAEDISQTFVLSNLPERFAHQYSVLFAQRLMAVMIDLTTKLTRGWSSPSCIAQELALKLLLDGVEVTADLLDVDLAPDWRDCLEDMMFEDLDHELLFARAMDGFEDYLNARLGMAPMKFDDWFTPFTGRNVPPYVLD